MSLEDFVNRKLNEPGDESDKEDIRALMASHLRTGVKLQQEGKLREALEEFQKEHNRPIKSDIDANIMQTSYVQVGVVKRKLGEVNEAIAALQKARELLEIYHVGTYPHGDLAEIYIELGKYDEAIQICQEWRESSRSGSARDLLAKALALKNKRSS